MPLRSPAALVAALLLPVVAALLTPAWPARAAAFTDSAGRRVILPDQIGRILPADRNAEVLVLVLAPDKLVGLERTPGRAPRLPRRRGLPALGWTMRSTPASMAATARQLGADLIIDAGPVTPQRAAFADQVQQQTGIPYILVDDSFARMPLMVPAMGAIFGVEDRANRIGRFADHVISGLRGRLLITPADTRPHVYYGLGYDGLTTALPGSPAGAALDEAGAINVAAALGRDTEVRISPAQLFGWDPPIIIAEQRSFFDALHRNPAWRRLSAVRDKRVYLEPTDPFGWIEGPSGVNRLIGLQWLSTLFYPAATAHDLRAEVCGYYDLFYRIKLTNAEVEALVRPAGAPPPTPGGLPAPLVGLGELPSGLPLATPDAGAAPGAGPGPSAGPPLPGLPSTAANATCAIPAGPMPQPLPGLAPLPAPPAVPPGVPPPGRRGRPVPRATEPGSTSY